MTTYDEVLDALADGNRRRILELLVRGPAPVSKIAEQLPVTRPAVSQHLRVLLDARLVDFDQTGTRNVYRLERSGFDTVRTWLDTFWQDVLDAFETYANRPDDGGQ